VRIGYLATLLRAGETTFGNYVAGAAELETAIRGTLNFDSAFVIPLIDRADRNQYSGSINQVLTERFGIVVALRNDSTDKDRLGIIAYDRLHNIRNELFGVFLNKSISEAESVIYYVGGSLKAINNGYIWYQFEFEYKAILGDEGLQTFEVDDTEVPTSFDTIYANYILAPSAELPHTGDLPLPDGFPDVAIPDMAQWIDLTDDPRAGAFSGAFSTAFDIYDEDRR
jgi:hypothetical protein